MIFSWEKDYRGNLDWLQERTVYLCVHGSFAYGLNTESSDRDFKGIVIPPKEYFHGFLKKFEQAESKVPDLTVYDIRKFFALAADCNPNIIELLYVDEKDIVQWDEFGSQLRQYRMHFLSQKARHTFSGYAVAQLKRIRTHRKWLLDPPTHKPTRGEFELPETTLISKDIMGAIEATHFDSEMPSSRKALIGFGPEVMHAYQRERAYHNALTQWHQYENWKKNRNPARAEIEAKHGYDAKHAMHLVRLLKMCREILTFGEVIVKRPDREELLAIRHGAWSYDRLVEWAEEQDQEMAELAERSPLPHSPDRVYLDTICRGLVEEFMR